MIKNSLAFAAILCLFGLGCRKIDFDYSHVTRDRIDSIILPDQTKMILNNYTNVFYHAPYIQEVLFSGEVYCIVKRGNGSPFRLLLGPNILECQNGEFNISIYDYELKAKQGDKVATYMTPLKLMVLKGEVTIINDTSRTVIPANTNAAIYPNYIWYLGSFWEEECGTWRMGYYHFRGLDILEFRDFLQTHFQIKADFDDPSFYGQYIYDIDIQANEPLLPQLQKIAAHNRLKVTYDEFNKILQITR